MPAIQLHIVGFPYRKDIEGHVSEFLADAPGRTMTVRVQRDNEVDSRAIRAYDWQGRHVGFVSRSDTEVVERGIYGKYYMTRSYIRGRFRIGIGEFSKLSFFLPYSVVFEAKSFRV